MIIINLENEYIYVSDPLLRFGIVDTNGTIPTLEELITYWGDRWGRLRGWLPWEAATDLEIILHEFY